MITKSNGVGRASPKYIMMPAVTIPPTRTCPSAPMFQNFILNAGASATDIHKSTMVSLMVIHILLFEPKAPLNMETYTSRGLSPVIHTITIADTISDKMIATVLMAYAFGFEIRSLLAI